MDTTPLVDWAPLARLLLLAATIALVPLAWLWLRQRGSDTRGRLAALTALTMFLTFDLVVFGSFTRLTDSGLGCPDWPGCYGEVSPFGARDDIHAAQSATPGGPVTWSKAWIARARRRVQCSQNRSRRRTRRPSGLRARGQRRHHRSRGWRLTRS